MPAYARGEARDWARERLVGAVNCTIPSFTADLKHVNEAAVRHDARLAVQPVITRAAEQPVVADLHVDIDRASQGVVARPAAEPVVALASLDGVVAGTAVQPVIAGGGEGHDVVAAAAGEDVVAGQSDNEVGAVVPKERVAPIASGKPLLGQGQELVVVTSGKIVTAIARDEVTGPASAQ